MEQQTENNAVPVENVSAPVSALPGALLREARERLGLSIADAAAHTKLAPRQIEALEADDYQHLPEMAFVRGFVRSYAKLLQLDVPPLLAALPQTHSVSHVSPDSVNVPFPDARSPQLQNLIWLGAALFLSVVVVAVAVWNFTSPSSPAEPDQPNQPVEAALPLPVEMQVIPASEVAETAASSVVPAVAQSAVPVAEAVSAPVATLPAIKQPQPVSAVKPAQPAAAAKPLPTTPAVKPVPLSAVSAVKSAPVAAKPTPIPTPTPTPTPVVPVAKPVAPAATSAAQSANLRLTFGEESWTEVRDKNGNIVSSQLNPAGSELRLSGQGPFTLVVGRASSARLTYKGKTVDLKPTTNATSDVARVTLE